MGQSLLWGDMTASERMASKLDYLSYNYGDNHPLVIAARAGDIDSFRMHAAGITELMDVAVVGIVDARD